MTVYLIKGFLKV